MERVHTPKLIVQATSEAGAGGRRVPVDDGISPGRPWARQDEKYQQ